MGRKGKALSKSRSPLSPPSTSNSPGTSTAQPPASASIHGEETFTIDRCTDHSVACKWTIPSIICVKSKAVYSPYFEVAGGVDFRIAVYPRGCSMTLPGAFSIYLQVIGRRSAKFNFFTHYRISVRNHLDESKSLHRASFNRFTATRRLYGWEDFTFSSNVLDQELGFISDNSLAITADIRVLNELTSFAVGDNVSKSASLISGSSGPSTSASSGKFTWTIKNFSLFTESFNNHKLMSHSFPVEDCDLHLSVYRSVVHNVDCLSLRLEGDETEKLPGAEDKSCWCMFRLSVLNQNSVSKSIHTDLQGRFSAASKVRERTFDGLCNYMDFSRFIDSDEGFLVDDTAVFSVSFQAIKESNHKVSMSMSPAATNFGLPNKSNRYQEWFVWKINNLTWVKDIMKKRKIKGLVIDGKIFQVGNQGLRMLVYPRGSSQPPCHLSFYIEAMEKSLDWSCFVAYRLSVMNHKTLDKSVSKDSMRRFSNPKKIFGWAEFMPLQSLFNQDSGFLNGDAINFCAEILLLKETFLKGKRELNYAGIPVDVLEKGECVLWIMDNFLPFKDILGNKKILSRAFQVGGCDLQIGVCNLSDKFSAFLGCDPGIRTDPEKNVWVSYRMALVNQKNFAKSVWRESSFFTKSRNFFPSHFMEIPDMLDPDAGFLVNESVSVFCQILDHCPWFDFSESGGLPSNDWKWTGEKSYGFFDSFLGKASDVTMEEDCITKIWTDADWMTSTMKKLCVYLEPIRAKDLRSRVKNWVKHDIGDDIDFSPFPENFWTAVKVSQWVIIDLLLEVMVECCRRSETRSITEYCYDTSSEFSAHRDRALCAVECLEEERIDIPENAILPQPPSKTSAVALLKFNSIQELQIKWPEQPKELLGMIINCLKALDDTVPQGLEPKLWPVSAKKISRVLDKAPNYLLLDLLPLVPKLVEHSELPLAGAALMDQLVKRDEESELLVEVFTSISQWDFSSEGWEHLFFPASKLLPELNDIALATAIQFLFKAAFHCQRTFQAVRPVRLRLCNLGINVSACVLDLLSKTVTSFEYIAEALLIDIDFCFELDDKNLESSGGPFLHSEDKQMNTELSMMDNQPLNENCHFSDVFILIEMLSVPAFASNASKAFERAVAQGSIVVQLVALVLERRHDLRLNIGPVSFLVKNLQGDEAADERIESSLVDEDDFPGFLGLVERFSLSRDSIVQQFAWLLYPTLFRLFGNDSYCKRLLKGLVDRAVTCTGTGHQADTDFSTLISLICEDQELAVPILNMMREVLRAADVDRAYLRGLLLLTEEINMSVLDEKQAELADMVSEKASLLKRISELEAAMNHYKSQLKREVDHFAREKKDLSKRIQEFESQLEWSRSEQENEISKLSSEKKAYKDHLKNLKTQISQMKSQNNEDVKRLVKVKHALAERLTSAESAKRRADEKLKCYAGNIQILKDNSHSLQDEIRQLKLTVGQLEQENLDKEEKIKQYETLTQQYETQLGDNEANFGAWLSYIHSLEDCLREEMSHAPLYGLGLEQLSKQELETVLRIHQEGIQKIHALKQQRASVSPNTPSCSG